jgi:hypothetical protein
MHTSILHMYFAQDANEAIREAHMKSVSSPAADNQPVYYWHIFRKSKVKSKLVKWVFVRDFYGTKADITKFWLKWFATGEYRLKCVLKYRRNNG